jgi:hypothetical protein
MNSHDLDERTAASLRRRLLAASEEVRAMATAESVDWHAPDFATDEAQQDAMHAMLRACSDARVAVRGHHDDDGFDDGGRVVEISKANRLRVASERAIALDRAIDAGVRAGRLLRQRGLKATIAAVKRVDVAGRAVLARAEIGFRRRATDRRAA